MKKLLFFLLNIIIVKSAFTQAWRSSLYPANWSPPGIEKDFYTDAFIQDYSYAGYQSGKISIPNITSNIINVTQAPYLADNSGVTDATVAIQTAINKAKSDGGGVVYLPSGTYKLSTGTRDNCLSITGNNIILRGDGVGQTFLYNDDTNMNDKSIIEVGGVGSNWQATGASSTLITSDLNGPTSNIPVASVTGYSVGDWVIVRNDATTAWCNEHGETDWAGKQSTLKGLMHYRQILSIDINNKILTIDVPIRYTLKTRDNSRVYKAPLTLSEIGLEGFSIGNKEVVTNTNEWLDKDASGNPVVPNTLNDGAQNIANSGASKCDGSWVIILRGLLNSWVKNVGTYKPAINIYRTQMLSNGLLLDQSRGVTLDNVYMGFAQWGGGSGSGYGFRIQSNDCLIKNCMTEVTRHGFVFSFMYSMGNVILQSTDKQSGLCTANSSANIKTGSSGSDFHMHFSPSNLIDGCTLDASYFSVLHRLGVGSSPFHNAVTAHSTLWNTIGKNSTGNLIRSSQTRTGYIMGTSGTGATGVDYKVADNGPAFRYDIGGLRTSPEDLVEGIGLGSTLEPQSLYLDQLAKRTTVPSTIITLTKEAEDFDTGGQNVGYYDTTTGNNGNVYRTTDDVDITASSTASNGFAVNDFALNEYMNYTFNITTPGYYKVAITASCRNRDDSNCDISLDGGSPNNLIIARTFDWAIFSKNTLSNDFYLTAGAHTLKILQKLSLSSMIDKVSVEQNITSLPIQLKYFNGLAKKDQIILNWETLAESNNDSYKILKSTDGNTFTLLSKVMANNKASVYQTTDRQPFAGVNYYKLLQIDKDGTENDKETIFVKWSFETDPYFLVYPNPAKTDINVQTYTSENQVLNFSLMSLDGKVLQTFNRQAEPGQNYINLKFAKNLPKGMYLLVLKGNSKTFSQKIYLDN